MKKKTADKSVSVPARVKNVADKEIPGSGSPLLRYVLEHEDIITCEGRPRKSIMHVVSKKTITSDRVLHRNFYLIIIGEEL